MVFYGVLTTALSAMKAANDNIVVSVTFFDFYYRNVQNLEQCLEEHEHQKKKAYAEIEKYKQTIEEKSLSLKQLTNELLETKTTFEMRISDFELALSNSDRQKTENMDSIIVEYKAQVNALKNQINEQSIMFATQSDDLRKSNASELEACNNKYNDLQDQMQKLHSDYDDEMQKVKAFYEHELEVMRKSTISDDNLAKQWHARESSLKLEANILQTSLHNKIKTLSTELDIKQEEINILKNLLSKSQNEASGTAAHIKVTQ